MGWKVFRGRVGLYCIITQCLAQQTPDHTSCERTSSLSTLLTGAGTGQLPRQLCQKEAPLVWKYSPRARDNLPLLKGLSSMCFWLSHLFPLVPLQLFRLWLHAVKESAFVKKKAVFVTVPPYLGSEDLTIYGFWWNFMNHAEVPAAPALTVASVDVHVRLQLANW